MQEPCLDNIRLQVHLGHHNADYDANDDDREIGKTQNKTRLHIMYMQVVILEVYLGLAWATGACVFGCIVVQVTSIHLNFCPCKTKRALARPRDVGTLRHVREARHEKFIHENHIPPEIIGYPFRIDNDDIGGDIHLRKYLILNLKNLEAHYNSYH